MRVAFVTPRYGPEVMGGAETAARQLAEHLVAECGVEAEAFTTCALDHVTWDNALEPGDSELAGVSVHRFGVEAGRARAFYELDMRLRFGPRHATMRESQRWVELNGPVVPDLVDAVCDSGADVVACYPYLYYPEVHTMVRAPMPAVLHPAAHDEPALYLPVFRTTFGAADGICYHTASERALVQRVQRVGERPQIVLGLGVGENRAAGRPGGEVLGLGDRPYVVSVGRVDAHKGSAMLAAFFRRYKARRPGPLALALVGPVAVDIPPHPDVVVTGALGEEDKWDVVRDALVSVSPSALESFSLVVLEAWAQGVPVMVNALCGPTREHCEHSGGGVWFSSYPEFEAAMDRLLADPGLRHTLGARGREYVESHFAWPVLIRRYLDFLAQVAERGRRVLGVLAASPSR